jgi:hypothetical protein
MCFPGSILPLECSPIAQLVEQVTVNHWVGGSSPSRGANLIKHLQFGNNCQLKVIPDTGDPVYRDTPAQAKTIFSHFLLQLNLQPHTTYSPTL